MITWISYKSLLWQAVVSLTPLDPELTSVDSCPLLVPGLPHRMAVVPANVSDLTVLPDLVAD